MRVVAVDVDAMVLRALAKARAVSAELAGAARMADDDEPEKRRARRVP